MLLKITKILFNEDMSILDFILGNKNSSIEDYPEAVIILSEDLKIKKNNKYASSLFQVKNLKNCDASDLFDCDFNILLNELLSENNICTLKLKNSDVYVEIKATHTKKKDIYFSLRDVTQKHKTVTSFMMEYETSKKINRTKNNLLVKLDNELTSPLHSITGFSQAMLEGLSGNMDAKQKKYLDIINKNASDLLTLMNHLVESAKLESGLYEFEMKNFDIMNMIVFVLNDIKEQNSNIKTITDFSKIDKRSIYTDETVLKKILYYLIYHLVKNTEYNEITIVLDNPELDYLKEQGFVVDENTQIKNFLHISISSNVDYVKPTDEDSIFEIYPQLENNNKRDVLNNLPLYDASLLAKYLKIKLSDKKEGKFGFDIILNIEKV